MKRRIVSGSGLHQRPCSQPHPFQAGITQGLSAVVPSFFERLVAGRSLVRYARLSYCRTRVEHQLSLFGPRQMIGRRHPNWPSCGWQFTSMPHSL